LSDAGAGSSELPDEKLPAVPPTVEAVPLPVEGRLVPVLVSASGTGLLKFHNVMVAAWAHGKVARIALHASVASVRAGLILIGQGIYFGGFWVID
jgi:hypothetical protein